MAQCQFCGADLPIRGRVPRREECPSCRRDLHCCRQCTFYDPTVHNACRETQAEWIVDKERANFCDFFRLSERPAARSGPRESAEEKWNKMFKKK